MHPDACAPLTGNWRSDPRLMGLVNAVSTGLFGDGYIPLAPQRPATGETYAELLRVAEGRRSRKSRPEQHVAARVAAILEARGPVADRDRSLKSPHMRPVEPGDIALLCPTHAMAARYAEALTAQNVQVRISAPGWMDAPAVMAARQALAFVADPTDAHAALCLLTLGPAAVPLEEAVQALSDDRLFERAELAPLIELAGEARVMPLETLLPRVLDAAGIPDWAASLPEAAQAHADLLRLEAELAEFGAAHRELKAAAGFHGTDARVFLGWLEARRHDRDFDRRPDPGSGRAQGVEIVTWHASKGREWPITVVVGLDNRIGERPGTLRAEFDDFSDLGAILERAKLVWTPALALKEKTEAFVEDRRPAAEDDARRLLYVALTRARDRLVLEWPDFALKKLGDGPGPANPAEILVTEARLAPEAGGLRLGETLFPARVRTCPAEPPALPDEEALAPPGPRPGFGNPRAARARTRTPWRGRPSQAKGGGAAPDLRRVTLAGPALPATLFASATDRGSALHLALRALLTRPELRPRLEAATGLDEAALDALAARAAALKDWLAGEGFTDIRCEVPVQHRAPSGAEINGVIDLLAEGPSGRLILDHKSGGGSLGDYLSQLQAYRGLLAGPDGQPAPAIAVHWIDRAQVEMAEGETVG